MVLRNSVQNIGMHIRCLFKNIEANGYMTFYRFKFFRSQSAIFLKKIMRQPGITNIMQQADYAQTLEHFFGQTQMPSKRYQVNGNAESVPIGNFIFLTQA